MSDERERQALRERLFDEGEIWSTRCNEAFAGLYVCPLCHRGFAREACANGLLELEHVPQQSIEPEHLLVLTCHDCNHRASTYEQHVVDHKRSSDLFRVPNAQLKVFVTIGDVRCVVDTYMTEDGAVIANVDRAHTKDASILKLDQLFTAVERELPPTFPMEPFRAPQNKLLGLGWMKNAYLANFALFGYLWTSIPALEILRRQFEYPKQSIRPATLNFDVNREPQRCLFTYKSPPVSVFVWDHMAVALPAADEEGLWEAMNSADPFTEAQAMLLIPTRPQYAYDRLVFERLAQVERQT